MCSSYKRVRFMGSFDQRTFPIMHEALTKNPANSMMTITVAVVEKLIILRWVCCGREQTKMSIVCCAWDTDYLLTVEWKAKLDCKTDKRGNTYSTGHVYFHHISYAFHSFVYFFFALWRIFLLRREINWNEEARPKFSLSNGLVEWHIASDVFKDSGIHLR